MARRIKSSLDPDRMPPVDERHTYRASDSWIEYRQRELVPSNVRQGLYPANESGAPRVHTRYHKEDVLRDWRQDFALREITDLQREASRVVLAINRGASPAKIAQAKRAFLDGLERNNLCWKCKQPIEVKRVPDAEVTEMRHKRLNSRFNASGRDISREAWAQKRQHYRVFADVPSHFVWEWDADNPERATYRYEDGTNRVIRVERVPLVYKRPAKKAWQDALRERDDEGKVEITTYRERYIEVLPDGSTRPVVPRPFYRIANLKCECKHRRPKTVKIRTV
jgi:hypothetical protein